MPKIKVNLKNRSYYIHISKNSLASIGPILKSLKLSGPAFIISNQKIRAIYGKTIQTLLLRSGIKSYFCIVPDSEKAKSHFYWFNTLKRLAEFDKGKGTVVIALGGGVIGDLAGFVASTYRRGVPFVQVPTTLLAQVDSAIGGKVAIDIECAKNIAGAFYQPKVVISDINVLKSLPLRQVQNGLAEVIKYGVILDKNLFVYLEKNISKILKKDTACLEKIVAVSSKLKAEIVGADEKETKGFRTILNFGHTIGHAIEAASSYKKSIMHGEAIAVGMLCACDIAVSLGIAKKALANRVEALIKKAGLKVFVRGINPAKIIKATAYDKKILKGKARWVLPLSFGHVAVCNKVPKGAIKKAVFKRVVS